MSGPAAFPELAYERVSWSIHIFLSPPSPSPGTTPYAPCVLTGAHAPLERQRGEQKKLTLTVQLQYQWNEILNPLPLVPKSLG